MDSAISPELLAALSDRYLIERQIGRGGMATVYLAEDRKHQRMVAIKVLHPELAVAVGPLRFRREITIAAQLQHPHVLPLLDSGAGAGVLWFAMPYVDGESLRQRLARERQLPLADALRITTEIASALEHAHQRGVIHRDVKPENILLAADGHALLADFGVARDSINFAEGTGERWTTDTGVSIGTLEYMSPEQTNGQRDLDARSDVYSLGCVLYEMLAGEPPFTGATPQTLIARRMVERPLPLRAVRDRIPASVEQAVDIALARVPADRFPSARAFADALRHTDAAPSPPALPPRQLARVASIAAAVLVVVGALVYGWQRFHAGPTATAPARLAVLPFDNASDSASGYLADGIADAIRGKLAGLGALQVIGRASSTQYRQTSKPPQLVAAELGVPYLLMGRVRSTPKPNGDRAIEIQSRLLHVVPGAAPTTIWTSSSDSGTTDVFHRESAIATNVAAALRITPTAAEAEQLADQPTRNAAAYDAFLQGEARQASSNPAFRERVILDTRAVTLDSTFGAAWAALSIAHSGLYFQDRPTVDEATAAADALARAQALDPGRPATQIALANYEIGIHHDPVRARAAAEDGLALAPDNVLLLATASAMERNTGAWDAALAHARRAELLDPRSARATFDVGTTLLYLRHYPEAIAEFDRALTLAPRAPGIIQFRTIASLCQGDTIGAHAAIARALATADTTTLVVFFATNNSLGWSLGDSLRQRMLHIDVSSFDDTASYATAKAEEYWARGDVVRARAYADTASRAFVNELRAAPQDDLLHLAHGFVLAILGRNAAAIEEGERGAAFMPVRTYAVNGLYDEQLLAQIYLIAGQPEKAIDHIAALLKIPSFLSPARLRIDPTWTPLRGNPRFQQLLASAH